ncbi:hypothetical protein EWM64_g9564, partial [Hericium alpestre]
MTRAGSNFLIASAGTCPSFATTHALTILVASVLSTDTADTLGAMTFDGRGPNSTPHVFLLVLSLSLFFHLRPALASPILLRKRYEWATPHALGQFTQAPPAPRAAEATAIPTQPQTILSPAHTPTALAAELYII